MSKTVFMTVITIAALLSLSVFATRYASSSSNDNNSNKKPSGDQGARDAINNAPNSNDALKKITKCFGHCENSGRGADDSGSSSGDGDGQHHNNNNKVKELNRLFRSGDGNTGSSAIDSIPVIPKMNFDTVNSTNATTVTIAVCDGIVPGPCYDKKTGQIIP